MALYIHTVSQPAVEDPLGLLKQLVPVVLHEQVDLPPGGQVHVLHLLVVQLRPAAASHQDEDQDQEQQEGDAGGQRQDSPVKCAFKNSIDYSRTESSLVNLTDNLLYNSTVCHLYKCPEMFQKKRSIQNIRKRVLIQHVSRLGLRQGRSECYQHEQIWRLVVTNKMSILIESQASPKKSKVPKPTFVFPFAF